MTFYVTNQNYVVLSLVILGAALALLYDLFTVKRIVIKTNNIILFFEDMLFCAVACVSFVLDVYITNYGYVRWYEFAALAAGFGIYRLIFGNFWVSVLVGLIKSVIAIITKVLITVLYPLRFMFGKICAIAAELHKRHRIYAEKQAVRRFSKKTLQRYINDSKKGFA